MLEKTTTVDQLGGTVFTKRPLGKTGLMVHPLSWGCGPLGDMPETFGHSVPEEQALATVRAMLDSPIHFVDTAGLYGDGESERRIGLVLHERGGLPPGFVLQTKAGPKPPAPGFGGDQIRRSVERSLRLLGLDRLQVLYLHGPGHLTFEEAMAPGGAVEALRRLKDEGVAEHLGLGGGSNEVLLRFAEIGLFETAITHNCYTLLDRSAEPLLEVAAEHGLAILNAAPYGSGILAKGPSAFARYAYRDAPAHLVARARQIEAACARYDVPLAAAALQFSLRNSLIRSTIVGISRPERVAHTLELATCQIPDALWEELDVLVPPPGDSALFGS